jgi:hypothetical protein
LRQHVCLVAGRNDGNNAWPRFLGLHRWWIARVTIAPEPKSSAEKQQVNPNGERKDRNYELKRHRT